MIKVTRKYPGNLLKEPEPRVEKFYASETQRGKISTWLKKNGFQKAKE